MKIKLLLLVAVLALCASIPVAAPQSALAQTTRFDAMDTDQDGYLSYDEVQAAFPNADQETFATMDGDNDGRLTHQEWAQNRNCLGLGQGYGQGGQGQGMGQGQGQGMGQGQGGQGKGKGKGKGGN